MVIAASSDRAIGIEEVVMALAIVLIILALILGGVGLVAKLAWWAFVIAAVLLLVGIILGAVGRGRTRV
jgi:hypothetical protein